MTEWGGSREGRKRGEERKEGMERLNNGDKYLRFFLSLIKGSTQNLHTKRHGVVNDGTGYRSILTRGWDPFHEYFP